MLRSAFLLITAALLAGAASADDLYLNAHGTILAAQDKIWLKANNIFFELAFDNKEGFQFAQALHNKKAHISGRLEIRIESGQLRRMLIRVSQITRQPREGYGQFNTPIYSGPYRGGVYVSPQAGSGVSGERAQELDLSTGQIKR